MTDSTSTPSDEATQNAALQKAVIVGMQLDQDPHVLDEAVRFARLLNAPLVVAHVDITRFVTYEDPDGYVHSAPIDINFDAGAAEFEAVEAAALHPDVEEDQGGSSLLDRGEAFVGIAGGAGAVAR